MHAYFDAKDGNPKVFIEIKGTKKGVIKQIAALFDTGHSGSLSLPVVDLVEIGAKLSTVGPVEFGDGLSKPQLFFSVKVTVDGIEREVDAMLIENYEATEAIAGLELFSSHIALINFKKKEIRFTTEEELRKSFKD